ncbi:MAG TPA: 4Fe-4S binding protein [Anaerolineae bacterium]|nr:4Fe-4S binding protein [Anaerolineae bacterium]
MSHSQLRFSFDPELCSLCDRCVTVCAYQARRLTAERQMLLDEATCRSCGLCVSVCSTGALGAAAA